MEKKNKFSILHLADFSRAGRIAFVHALKIALALGAELSIVLTKAVNAAEKNWPHNPPVRTTLEQWKILRNGSRRAAAPAPAQDGEKPISAGCSAQTRPKPTARQSSAIFPAVKQGSRSKMDAETLQ